jgi:hypothetical protein
MNVFTKTLPQWGRGTTAGGGGARAFSRDVRLLLPCPSTMLCMVPFPVPGRIS